MKIPVIAMVCMLSCTPVFAATSFPENNMETTEKTIQTEETTQTGELTQTDGSTQENSFSNEPTDENTVSLFSDSSDVFDSYLYSNQTFGTSFSDMFFKLTGKEISQEELIDVSAFDGALDAGQVNMQYQTLSQNLLAQTETEDESGKAQNASDLFQSSYGDLASQISVNKAEIPKNFDVNKMMNQAEKSVNKAYKSTMKSSSFKSVKKQLSIGSIFSKAKSADKNGLSAPSVSASQLASNSKLSSMVTKASSSAKNKINGEYKSNSGKVNDFVSNAKENSKNNTSGKSYGDASDHQPSDPKRPHAPVTEKAIKVKNYVKKKTSNTVSKAKKGVKNIGSKIKNGTKSLVSGIKNILK